MSNTAELIASLSKEATPVKPAPHPYVLFAKWIAGAGIYLAILVACLGLRSDIALKGHDPLFVAEIALLAAMIIASVLSISLLSFPDMYQKRLLAFTPVLPLLLFCMVLALEYAANIPSKPPHPGIDCMRCIVFSSLVPAAFIIYRLRAMATTHPMLCGSIALLGATSMGCLALRLSEETDSITHLLEWHYLPMLVCSLLGLALGRIALKW